MTKLISNILFFAVCFFAAATQWAQVPLRIPEDVKAFIGADQVALALVSGDLNGDGTEDHVLVLENAKAASNKAVDDKRSLLVIISGPDGKLTLAKRNDKVAYCRSCGGAFGDPFDAIYIQENGFSVFDYGGGSRWRWSRDFHFRYSRRDQTWQLVQVTEGLGDLSSGEKYGGVVKSTFPKDFGKVDLADFDPKAIPKLKRRRRAK